MDWVSDPEVWSALATLLVLEVVLGVDNVVFISIVASKLPDDQQQRALRAHRVGRCRRRRERHSTALRLRWCWGLAKRTPV